MQMRTQKFLLQLLKSTVLCTALSLAFLTGVVSGQRKPSQDQPQRTYPVVSWETYLKVLDAVFPRNDPDTSKTIFEFVLRFRPSFHGTSQIVIRNRGDKTEVIEYTSPDGNIFDKL